MEPTDADRFRQAFDANARDVLGYALRRVEVAADAADVVAETFLVAWRRVQDMPAGTEARPWLFGVARGVLRNQRRGDRRRHRLGRKLRSRIAALPAADPGDAVADGEVARRALERLAPDDAEVLRLTAWEGLTPAEVAVVLGVPAATARSRLARARRRLRAELEALGWQPARQAGTGHVRGDGHPPVRDREEER